MVIQIIASKPFPLDSSLQQYTKFSTHAARPQLAQLTDHIRALFYIVKPKDLLGNQSAEPEQSSRASSYGVMHKRKGAANPGRWH